MRRDPGNLQRVRQVRGPGVLSSARGIDDAVLRGAHAHAHAPHATPFKHAIQLHAKAYACMLGRHAGRHAAAMQWRGLTSSSVTQTSPSPVQHFPHSVHLKVRPSLSGSLKGRSRGSEGPFVCCAACDLIDRSGALAGGEYRWCPRTLADDDELSGFVKWVMLRHAQRREASCPIIITKYESWLTVNWAQNIPARTVVELVDELVGMRPPPITAKCSAALSAEQRVRSSASFLCSPLGQPSLGSYPQLPVMQSPRRSS